MRIGRYRWGVQVQVGRTIFSRPYFARLELGKLRWLPSWFYLPIPWAEWETSLMAPALYGFGIWITKDWVES